LSRHNLAYLETIASASTGYMAATWPTFGKKQKATARVAFAAKCLSHLAFVWLPDLGSNQGPTD